MRKILVTVAAILLTACGGGTPTSPSDSAPLTERIVTAHFVFHFAANDHVDADWQEAYHAWAVAQLGVSPPVIDYDKYRNRAHMAALTGHANSNGYTEPPQTVIHSIWPSDGHEAVHIYTIPWGFPVALFEEGIAVGYQTNPPAGDFVPKWSGRPIHDIARQFHASGQLLPIASIAETATFRTRSDQVTYPEAGSFVRYLIDTEGLVKMRRLFGTMGIDAPLATVRSAFQQTYGFSLDEAEQRWLAFLG